jgi:hypothetical protein
VFQAEDAMSILEPLLIVFLEYAAPGSSATPSPPSGNGS